MLKRSFLFLFSIFFLLANTSISSAEEKWIDQNYNFSNVKTILVMEPSFKNEPDSEITINNVKQIFYDNLQFKNAKIFDLNRVDVLITVQTGEDIRSLRETDPDKANELFNQYVGDNVDLILYTYIKEYNIGSRFVAAHYENKTRYETITVEEEVKIDGKKQKRKKEISVPHTYQDFVPAHYVRVISSSVDFKVINAKDQKSVFLFSERRAKEPSAFEESTPINMYTRTVKAFSKELHKKIT